MTAISINTDMKRDVNPAVIPWILRARSGMVLNFRGSPDQCVLLNSLNELMNFPNPENPWLDQVLVHGFFCEIELDQPLC